jgi:hypothetical protein
MWGEKDAMVGFSDFYLQQLDSLASGTAQTSQCAYAISIEASSQVTLITPQSHRPNPGCVLQEGKNTDQALGLDCMLYYVPRASNGW